MIITFSESKNRTNRRKHGISLERSAEMDFSTAVVIQDDSQDYGETRQIAIGFLAGTLYVLVFTLEDNEELRAISLRKAKRSERDAYAEYHEKSTGY